MAVSEKVPQPTKSNHLPNPSLRYTKSAASPRRKYPEGNRKKYTSDTRHPLKCCQGQCFAYLPCQNVGQLLLLQGVLAGCKGLRDQLAAVEAERRAQGVVVVLHLLEDLERGAQDQAVVGLGDVAGTRKEWGSK